MTCFVIERIDNMRFSAMKNWNDQKSYLISCLCLYKILGTAVFSMSMLHRTRARLGSQERSSNIVTVK